MSRSIFLAANEKSTSNDLRFVHNRMNETLPIVFQSSSSVKPAKKLTTQNNRRMKGSMRDQRRATGIRPDEVSLADTSTEDSASDDDEEAEITAPVGSFDHNRNMSSAKSMFTVTRSQPSSENLRTDPRMITSSAKVFRPRESILTRIDEQTSDENLSSVKYRQLEERLHTLETLVDEKDSTIDDLQHKLDKLTQSLTNAEQQIFLLHQDKLTLLKALATFQDN